MRNKTSLTLIELLIMLFVFIFAIALCLGIFVKADEMTEKSEARDRAVIIAKNAAELIEESLGDTKKAEDILSAYAKEKGLLLEIIKNEPESHLGTAKINVKYEEELIFSLDAAWQEVSENE